MPRRRRILIALVVFLAVGEAVVRFDQATFFLRGERAVVLDNVARATPLLRAVEDGSFRPQEDEYRVMVVGDSYLHGNRMADRARFAAQLERRLSLRLPGRRVRVLDLTVPGANTWINARSYRDHRDTFRPHALVWAYDADDVYGRLHPAAPDSAAPAATSAAAPRPESALRWLHAALTHTSRLAAFVIPTLGRELESRGLVLPGTFAHHLLTRSHDGAFPGWRRSREILDAVLAECRERGTRVLVLNVPELNLLGNYGVRRDVDARIAAWFEGRGVDYLRGIDLFAGRRAGDYAVSRYDGHPNGRAHGVLAQGVAARLAR